MGFKIMVILGKVGRGIMGGWNMWLDVGYC